MTIFLCTVDFRWLVSAGAGNSGAEGRGFEPLPAYHLSYSTIPITRPGV